MVDSTITSSYIVTMTNKSDLKLGKKIYTYNIFHEKRDKIVKKSTLKLLKMCLDLDLKIKFSKH